MKRNVAVSLLLAALSAALLLGVAHSASSQRRDEEVVEFAAIYDESGPRSYGVERAAGSKSSWPELVGHSFPEAKQVIEREAPDVAVYKVLEGAAVTADYSEQRVRVFVDGQGKVAQTPRRG